MARYLPAAIEARALLEAQERLRERAHALRVLRNGYTIRELVQAAREQVRQGRRYTSAAELIRRRLG